MVYDAPIRGKKIELATDFAPYFKFSSNWHQDPLLLLPNVEQVTDSDALNSIALYGRPSQHVYALHPFLRQHDPRHLGAWATVFFNTLQSGNLDGSGLIVFGKTYMPPLTPYAATFALCKHKNQNLPSAKPHRGFYDQFCTECGLDTSYDSSD